MAWINQNYNQRPCTIAGALVNLERSEANWPVFRTAVRPHWYPASDLQWKAPLASSCIREFYCVCGKPGCKAKPKKPERFHVVKTRKILGESIEVDANEQSLNGVSDRTDSGSSSETSIKDVVVKPIRKHTDYKLPKYTVPQIQTVVVVRKINPANTIRWLMKSIEIMFNSLRSLKKKPEKLVEESPEIAEKEKEVKVVKVEKVPESQPEVVQVREKSKVSFFSDAGELLGVDDIMTEKPVNKNIIKLIEYEIKQERMHNTMKKERRKKLAKVIRHEEVKEQIEYEIKPERMHNTRKKERRKKLAKVTRHEEVKEQIEKLPKAKKKETKKKKMKPRRKEVKDLEMHLIDIGIKNRSLKREKIQHKVHVKPKASKPQKKKKRLPKKRTPEQSEDKLQTIQDMRREIEREFEETNEELGGTSKKAFHYIMKKLDPEFSSSDSLLGRKKKKFETKEGKKEEVVEEDAEVELEEPEVVLQKPVETDSLSHYGDDRESPERQQKHEETSVVYRIYKKPKNQLEADDALERWYRRRQKGKPKVSGKSSIISDESLLLEDKKPNEKESPEAKKDIKKMDIAEAKKHSSQEWPPNSERKSSRRESMYRRSIPHLEFRPTITSIVGSWISKKGMKTSSSSNEEEEQSTEEANEDEKHPLLQGHLHDSTYQIYQIRQFLESKLELRDIDNRSFHDIDFNQFLFFPYDGLYPNPPKPPKLHKVRRKRKRKPPQKPKLTKEECVPPPRKKCEKCNCWLCQKLERNRTIPDTPLIAQLKREALRQNLKAYILQRSIMIESTADGEAQLDEEQTECQKEDEKQTECKKEDEEQTKSKKEDDEQTKSKKEDEEPRKSTKQDEAQRKPKNNIVPCCQIVPSQSITRNIQRSAAQLVGAAYKT